MILILFILVSLACPLSAQEIQFQQEQYPFPVTFYGVEPQLGFTAASSYYHHDFGDIDNDGDYDLIIGASMGKEYYFENNGTPQLPEFQLIINQIVAPFSGYMYQSPTFCDIDSDSDLDIFITGFDGYIIYYENIGTPISPNFVLSDSSFEGIDIIEGCVLDFVDIDADNDFDLFIGGGYGPYGGKIYFYENVGNSLTYDFSLITSFFSNIDVGENASPEFCDIDADGDYDLFIGCDAGTVWFYENIGDSVNYDFEFVTSNYFNIDVGNMSVPRFCDIDADGDFDLFVANESAGSGNSIEGDMTFYENIGSSSNPQFSFVTSQYLFMDMSASSSPSAVDIDDDGLTELLVGITPGKLVLLENEGTQTEPSFYFADSAFCNLNLPSQPKTTFGDLDADGDLDLVTSQGGFFDYIYLYENIGSASNPEFVYLQTIEASWDTIFYGIDLCDIDADGDLDLFCGSSISPYGYISYWENMGAPDRPNFVFQTMNYLNQTVGACHYPRFSDLDHDGDYDLVMGHTYYSNCANHIIFWRNIGTPQLANFVIEDTIATYEPGTVGSPRLCLTDIDNDGDLDIFVGESGGAMLFYRNLENPLQLIVTISIQGSDVILTWSDIANAAEYRIFYQDIPYFTPSGTPQAVVLPPDTSWTDYGAVNEGGRYYRVVVEGE